MENKKERKKERKDCRRSWDSVTHGARRYVNASLNGMAPPSAAVNYEVDECFCRKVEAKEGAEAEGEGDIFHYSRD